MTYLGDTRIIFHFEDEPVFLPSFLSEFLLQLLSIGDHGTEFIHFERLAVQSDTGLREEHRTAIIKLDGDGDAEKNRRGNNQRAQ